MKIISVNGISMKLRRRTIVIKFPKLPEKCGMSKQSGRPPKLTTTAQRHFLQKASKEQ